MNGSYVFTPGAVSTVCVTIKTSPVLVGAPVSTHIATNDGAVEGPTSISGTTDDNGSMGASFTITRLGSYTVTSTVTFPDGTTTTVALTVNVTSAAGAGC